MKPDEGFSVAALGLGQFRIGIRPESDRRPRIPWVQGKTSLDPVHPGPRGAVADSSMLGFSMLLRLMAVKSVLHSVLRPSTNPRV